MNLRTQGKIRYLGLTDRFIYDTDYQTLQLATRHDPWDVVMIGFNLINPSARKMVITPARAGNIGVLIMFALRRALSNPDVARDLVDELVAAGEVDGTAVDPASAFGVPAG